jgi:hypothetical protein
MSSRDEHSDTRPSSVADMPTAAAPPENRSAPSALDAYQDRKVDPTRSPFYATCPKCKQAGLFVPETLHRWCSAENTGAFFSEPARHLVRAESLDSYGRDADLDRATHVIFASSCPNPSCQSPLFLKVAGRKEEFAKIIRKRLGRPKGQAEEDLRLAELRLIDTLPKATEQREWQWVCNPELGALCPALNKLAPSQVAVDKDGNAKRDPYDVAASCREVLSALLLKLEAKQQVLFEVSHIKKKIRWGIFGFMLDLGRPHSSISRLVLKAFEDKKGANPNSFDFEDFIDSIFTDPFSQLRKKIEEELKSRYEKVSIKSRPSVTARVKRLYESSLIDRGVWRWAVQLQNQVGADGEFYAPSRSKELAAFVRFLADDGFEQPGEIVASYRRGFESPERYGSRIPTKV